MSQPSHLLPTLEKESVSSQQEDTGVKELIHRQAGNRNKWYISNYYSM